MLESAAMNLNIRKIRNEMTRLGLNESGLAKLMGVSRPLVYYYLRENHTDHRFSTVEKLAKAFDMDTKDLIE